MILTKRGEKISISNIELMISKFIFYVIDENIPHIWFATEEPFLNQYNGNISYDYSGNVKIMTEADLKDIKDISPSLESFLEEIYIDQWKPTYNSNYGKVWTNYKDLLQEYFDEWKYNNFDLYDEDGNELNEELEDNLDKIYYKFLEKKSFDIYYRKILDDIKSQ